MRNRFPGECYRCGEHVEAGAGHFEKQTGRAGMTFWKTQHAECAILYRGSQVGRGLPRGARATEADVQAVNRQRALAY